MIRKSFTVFQTKDGIQEQNIEILMSEGLGIHVVGLVDTNMKEMLLRTVNAMVNGNFKIPGRKIVINILPSNLCKENTNGYDLPVAAGLIAASEQMDLPLLENFILTGELGLEGEVRPTGMAESLTENTEGKKYIISEKEAENVKKELEESVYAVSNLKQAIGILSGEKDSEKFLLKNIKHSGKI